MGLQELKIKWQQHWSAQKLYLSCDVVRAGGGEGAEGTQAHEINRNVPKHLTSIFEIFQMTNGLKNLRLVNCLS